MISPERIAEITALAEAATPGEWAVHPHRAYVVPLAHALRPIGGHVDDAADLAEYAQEICAIHMPDRHRAEAESYANAAFIAAARTAVPELLAEREAMVARMASATEAFESIKEFADSGENFLCWKVADDAIAALKEQS